MVQGSKICRLIVNNEELAVELDEKGIKTFFIDLLLNQQAGNTPNPRSVSENLDMFFKPPGMDLTEIDKRKLKEIIKYTVKEIDEVVSIFDEDNLYRGNYLNKQRMKTIERRGKDKNIGEISQTEIDKFKRLNMDPKKVFYADKNLSKAWEYVPQNKTGFILAYDPEYFEKPIPEDHYLYMIKRGDFKEALKLLLIIRRTY